LSGHFLPSQREESSKLGSGGNWGRGTVVESGLVVACLFQVNTRPRKPKTNKTVPAIISQCGNKSRSIFPSITPKFLRRMDPRICKPSKGDHFAGVGVNHFSNAEADSRATNEAD
jgi:hypothetical protein